MVVLRGAIFARFSVSIKNGRPPYEPTDQGARLVRELAGFGVPQTAIATILEIHVETLVKYYGREFATGKAMANAKVAKSLYRKAIGNGPSAVTAAIFWAKTQMGWRELKTAAELDPYNLGSLTDDELDELQRLIEKAAPRLGQPHDTAEPQEGEVVSNSTF
jgi:hypothetical protein